MANKRLGTAATELKLPTKKVKGEKNPKWQAKMGCVKGKRADEVVETLEVVEIPVDQQSPADQPTNPPPEPTDAASVATTPELAEVVPNTLKEAETMNDSVPTTPEATPIEASEEPTEKPRKLKIKADAPHKKLSMVAAALQVLRDRKVAMTCPELIDVMATGGLWVSPGGKTPANTLYAAISRIIKEKGKNSAFRKAERGRFEAV